jgi:hypothetical protein
LARTALAAAASGANTDITSISPTGSLTFSPTTGTLVGAPTGGVKGAGTINAAGLFINGIPVGTGSGSVSSVSVVAANGFDGTVATASTTPAITLKTSVTGVLKGNGTAISAAVAGTDYVVPSGSITGSAATLTTARTFTIGATGKTFNGSANVAWTLAEIGAAASGANTDITSLASATTINSEVIGYRKIPRSTTSGTAATADVGKCIVVTANIAIPNSTFAAGDAISIYNAGTGPITITASVATLRLAGTATTGNRTLAQYGIATIWFNSATEAIISGSGLS